ncbi:hypothetical protein FJY68_08475, partial [candidate division WOR-3 bacterium]|nr:hypothetical protein [candidate division WOR-3 bacterium]
MLIADVHLWQFYGTSPYTIPGTSASGEYNLLTKNNGSHAVGLTEYDNASKAWLSIVSERTNSSGDGLGGYA